MNQIIGVVGNPTSILIERFFWLGLGGFLALALINSLMRGWNEDNSETSSVTPMELENLAQKAIQKNKEFN